MKTKALTFSLLALGLACAGCHFRQPKEFKNKKYKEDPPILNQAPLGPAGPALAAVQRSGKGA